MARYSVWLAMISQIGRTCETDDKGEGGTYGKPAAQGNHSSRLKNDEGWNGLILLDLLSFSERRILSTAHKASSQVACASTLIVPIEQLYSHTPLPPP